MENDQQSTPPSCSTASTNGRQATPSLPVYSGMPDRQAVQVIQQALHRQPSTAAQYLQQMYAAQQQHLMLQTAALQQQQQHLSSTQLQSLAAAQQAGLAAGRQGTPPVTSVSQQNLSQPQSINLTTSPQIISRAQSATSTPASSSSGVSPQTVLLGNPASNALSASQAQMYLRAQMLIFTPTATVTSVQSEVSAGGVTQSPVCSTQVQNLAVRGKHIAAAGTLSTQSHLPSLAMKPPTSNLQTISSASHAKPAGHVLLPAGRGGAGDPSDTQKKLDSQSVDSRAATNGRPLAPVSAHSIIAPAYSHQMMQQKQVQHQFVIQHQQQIQPRPVLPVAQISSPLQPLHQQPQMGPCLGIPPAMSHLEAHAACTESNGQRHSPAIHVPVTQACRLLQDGQKTTMQCAPLSQSSTVILHIQAPAATTSQSLEAAQKYQTHTPRDLSIGPPLVPASLGAPSPPRPAATVTDPPELNRPPANGTSQPVFSNPAPQPAPDMTSGNGSSPVAAAATGSSAKNCENKPPQAVVRPQILTHVIEGFVIQEGAQPFPSRGSRGVSEVGRSSLLVGSRQTSKQGVLVEKPPHQDNNTTTTTDSEMEETYAQESKDVDGPTLQCELCGQVDFEYNFKRSKRFCSMVCAKRYNVGCTKRMGLFHPARSKAQKSPKPTKRKPRKGIARNLNADAKKPLSGPILPASAMPLSNPTAMKDGNSQEDSSRGSDISSYEEPLSPLSASSYLSQQLSERELELHDERRPLSPGFLSSSPTHWKVEDVYEFIRSLPGCQEISEEFRAQEIDGQALLLLREEHLMSAMNIKLGPALKIYARISTLKDS